jgi:hypothetical protein
MTIKEQIDSFYRFATDSLANLGAAKSVDELFDQWRFENRSPEEVAEDVAAIQAAIDDMQNGDTGRDASEIERELRNELRIPANE